jgi:uncharacterized protein YdeI (YjbR/CyaY-like superfamily)
MRRECLPGIVGVIVVAFAQFVDRRIDRSSTIKRAMFVSLLVIGAFKEFCSLSFFKGVLLTDTNQLLQKAGENSQTMRLLKFTSPEQVIEQSTIINQYILEAIEIEKSGVKIPKPDPSQLDLCKELVLKFEELPELKIAFDKLTPGRQRGYNLHFSDAKQSATRIARIEKYIPKILSGKGFQD